MSLRALWPAWCGLWAFLWFLLAVTMPPGVPETATAAFIGLALGSALAGPVGLALTDKRLDRLLEARDELPPDCPVCDDWR